jgi:hypothetical protein
MKVFYVEDDVLARQQTDKKISPDAAIFYSLGYEDAMQEVTILLKNDISREDMMKELMKRINMMNFHNIYK